MNLSWLVGVFVMSASCSSQSLLTLLASSRAYVCTNAPQRIRNAVCMSTSGDYPHYEDARKH